MAHTITRRRFAKRPTRSKLSGYICLCAQPLLRSAKRGLYCAKCDHA